MAGQDVLLEIGRKINKSYLIKRLIMGYFAIKSVNPIIFFCFNSGFPYFITLAWPQDKSNCCQN
jgi:hypothetical protein